MPQIKDPHGRVVVSIFFLLGSILFLLLIAHEALEDLAITRHQIALTGMITEHLPPVGKSRPTSRFSYEFNGARYTAASDMIDRAAPPGTSVAIEIDSTHPERVRTAGGTRGILWFGTIVSLLFVIVGLVAVNAAWQGLPARGFEENPEKYLVRHELQNEPPQAIAQAREGDRVKITGRLRYIRPPLLAPLSGRPCACYQVRVERCHNAERFTLLHAVRAVEFRVDDGTGTMVVRATNDASLLLVKDVHQRSASLTELTPEMKRLFADNDWLERRGLLSQSEGELLFHEGILEEGEQVAVAGEIRREVDQGSEGHGYRESAQRFVMASTPAVRLVISDDPEAINGVLG
jgi:hypothetical protein